MAKENLAKANKDKKNEFYTQYDDIEREMNAYYEYDKKVFKDKTILLPCDDPEWSNFTKYFVSNFDRFGLKKLISTSYALSSGNKNTTDFEKNSKNYDKSKHDKNGKVFILTKKDEQVKFEDIEFEYLDGDGDFRSDEVKKYRDEADIIITNPPFSLFREFVAWIMESNKNFAIVGNQNAITYKEIFPLIKENKIWLGNGFKGNVGFFKSPYEDKAVASEHKKGLIRISGVMWFTNMDFKKRHETIDYMTMEDNLKYNKKLINKLKKDFGEVKYQKYDNYIGLDVPISEAIPKDYEGIMGVPITFLDKYNPEKFEIVGLAPERAEEGKDLLRVKKYLNAKQHNENGTETTGNKVNDGPVIAFDAIPKKYPYYTSETAKDKYLQVQYARILIKFKKEKENDDENNS